MVTVVAMVAAGCQERQAVDLSELERSCMSYCAKRFECLDVLPFSPPDPPTDLDDCVDRCSGDVPENLECLPLDVAYSDCLGSLSCEEIVTFYAGPYSEEAKSLCFVEFEDASFCE
jgi:hypothetical protein